MHSVTGVGVAIGSSSCARLEGWAPGPFGHDAHSGGHSESLGTSYARAEASASASHLRPVRPVFPIQRRRRDERHPVSLICRRPEIAENQMNPSYRTTDEPATDRARARARRAREPPIVSAMGRTRDVRDAIYDYLAPKVKQHGLPRHIAERFEEEVLTSVTPRSQTRIPRHQDSHNEPAKAAPLRAGNATCHAVPGHSVPRSCPSRTMLTYAPFPSLAHRF